MFLFPHMCTIILTYLTYIFHSFPQILSILSKTFFSEKIPLRYWLNFRTNGFPSKPILMEESVIDFRLGYIENNIIK